MIVILHEVCGVVGDLGYGQQVIAACHLHSFCVADNNEEQTWMCCNNISPAHVPSEVKGSHGPGSYVALPEHTTGPDTEAHFQGWS